METYNIKQIEMHKYSALVGIYAWRQTYIDNLIILVPCKKLFNFFFFFHYFAEFEVGNHKTISKARNKHRQTLTYTKTYKHTLSAVNKYLWPHIKRKRCTYVQTELQNSTHDCNKDIHVYICALTDSDIAADKCAACS